MQPRMVEDITSEDALLGVAVEHGSHEGFEEFGLLLLEAISR
jgi:hypothetical protein